MTGFGSGSFETSEFTYRCELKSVNSRFLDLNFRMARSLAPLEQIVSKTIKKNLARGKIDVTFDIQAKNNTGNLPELNEEALEHYNRIMERVAKKTGANASPSVSDYLRLEGVLETSGKLSSDEIIDRHKTGVLGALDGAIQSLCTARKREGEELKQALAALVVSLGEQRQKITRSATAIQDGILGNYRKKVSDLLEKMGDPGVQAAKNLPEERLLVEIAILADKADIAEELTRLETHELEFNRNLSAGREVGRKLDFLCQELHREVNTIASKISQSEVNQDTLVAKQIVEKLRQQVQNIE